MFLIRLELPKMTAHCLTLAIAEVGAGLPEHAPPAFPWKRHVPQTMALIEALKCWRELAGLKLGAKLLH